jgi:hypothetical protein
MMQTATMDEIDAHPKIKKNCGCRNVAAQSL